jgi:hypothetical protein
MGDKDSLKEGIKATGKFTAVLTGKDGKVKETREVNNLVVTAGKTALAAFMAAATNAAPFMPFMAIGTDDGTILPLAVGNVALGAAVGTRPTNTITSAGAVYQAIGVFAAGNPATLQIIAEAGLWSLVTGGTLFARQVFAPISKDTGDTLTITWQVTIS